MLALSLLLGRAAPVAAAPAELPSFTTDSITTLDDGRSSAGSEYSYYMTGDWGGLRSRIAGAGVRFELVDITDIFGNPTGGRTQGLTLETFGKVGIFVDLDKVFGIPDTTLYASATTVLGRGISADHLNNLLFVTDIEARRGVELYKAWLQQKLLDGRASLRLGIEDVGDDFARHRHAGLFINTSYAFPALGYVDIHASPTSYPLSRSGLRLFSRFKVSDEVTLLAQIYRGALLGSPLTPESNGLVEMAELQLTPVPSNPSIPTFKFGGWHQAGTFPDFRYDTQGASLVSPASNGNPLLRHGNFGVYTVVEQSLWRDTQTQGRAVSGFVRALAAPGDRNYLEFYADAGVVWTAPLAVRASDRLGLALGYTSVGSSISGLDQAVRLIAGQPRSIRDYEAVLELTYQLQLEPWFTIQPDFQYVFHPGAHVFDPSDPSGKPLGDAAVLGIRVTTIF